ncbi:hypothetical protein [Streptomyces sp. KR80]
MSPPVAADAVTTASAATGVPMHLPAGVTVLFEHEPCLPGELPARLQLV